MRLLRTLQQLNMEKRLSFHMPGHKSGRLLFSHMPDLLSYDITEIPGADNLHDASGCILETEQAISAFYGSKVSKILVGGSTVGILSMILGATRPGDRVLVNRNAHKSVYNAIEMNQLVPVYVFPEMDDYLGIPIALDVDRVNALVRDVKICILTYPTYEGLCYPIEEIINCCKMHRVPVLIDEAHGAHLILDSDGPKSSLSLGADVVVQSFHKTLPAMTQTACIHFSNGHHLSEGQVERILWYLKSLQTSSPSYVLMASVDHMLEIIETEGIQKMNALKLALESFYIQVNDLKSINVHRFEHSDPTKIILKIPPDYYDEENWNGRILAQRLLEKYAIQAEYDSKTIVLMMTSICTTAQDLNRLAVALQDIDLDKRGSQKDLLTPVLNYQSVYDQIAEEDTFVYCASEVVDLETIEIDVANAVGHISASYVIPYPPGIPILVPGERIKDRTIALFPSDLERIRVIWHK